MPINSFENYYMSWKPVLEKDGAPFYIQLADQLRRDISGGRLKPGARLPPQRELADFLDINVSTVSRAFRLCEQKGLLSGNVGSGTYVSYNIDTNILETPRQAAIELGSMMPELIPQHEMAELVQQMASDHDFESFFQYSHDIAARHQSAAVRLLSLAGCHAQAGNLLFSSGGQNAISAIFAGLFKAGDRVGVDPLVYPGLKSAAKLFGIQLVPIAQQNGEMSEAGLLYAIQNENIRALYVMPEAQNPTTHTMSLPCRQMIARTAQAHGLLIIEDGINCLLTATPAAPICAFAPERTIFILSLSKTINPALRLAYLAAPEQYRSHLKNALYNLNISQSSLLMELASRLILSGKLEALLARRKAGVQARNRITDEILRGYKVYGDQSSLSRWLILPERFTGMEFERAALARGISVYGVERFAVGSAHPEPAARLAICAPETIEQLKQGLTVIRELLE